MFLIKYCNYSILCSSTLTTILLIANTGIYLKNYLNKLEKLQNKALRKIFKTSLPYPITPHYHQSEILKLNDLFNLEVAKFMHQIIHKKLPKFLNYALYIHLLFLHTPIVNNVQTTCFYLVLILLEHNDP